MTHSTFPRLLAVAAVALLAACGSSMNDAGANAAEARGSNPLATVDDAAMAVAYVTIADALDDTTDSLRTVSQESAAKAYSMAKRMVSDQCPGGGRSNYNDESADETIVINFDDCRDNQSGYIDGKLTLVCLSGSFGNDSCRNLQLTFGEGSREFRYSNDTTSGKISGTWEGQDGSTFVMIEQTLNVRIQDLERDRDVAAVTDNFVRDIEDLGNGDYSVDISGDFGVSYRGTDVQCATGSVNFTTINRIYIDQSNRPTAGRIRLTNVDGVSATVDFLDDANLMITLSDGTTGMVTASQFESFCNFD